MLVLLQISSRILLQSTPAFMAKLQPLVINFRHPPPQNTRSAASILVQPIVFTMAATYKVYSETDGRYFYRASLFIRRNKKKDEIKDENHKAITTDYQ